MIDSTISQEGFFSEIRHRWKLKIKKKEIPADWFKQKYEDWAKHYRRHLEALIDPRNFESWNQFIQDMAKRFKTEKDIRDHSQNIQTVIDDLQFWKDAVFKSKEKYIYIKTQDLCYSKIQELGSNNSDFKQFSLFGMYYNACALLINNKANIENLLKYLKAKKENSTPMAIFYANKLVGLCGLVFELQSKLLYSYHGNNFTEYKDPDPNKTYAGISYNPGMWSTLNALYLDYIFIDFVNKNAKGGISFIVRQISIFRIRSEESFFMSFVSILGIIIIAKLSISLARSITYKLKAGKVDSYNDRLRDIVTLSININELEDRAEKTIDVKEKERLQSIIDKQEKIRDKIKKKIDKHYRDLKREHDIIFQEVEEDFDDAEKEIKEYPQKEQHGEIIL